MDEHDKTRLAKELKDIIDMEGSYFGVLQYWDRKRGIGNIRCCLGTEDYTIVLNETDIAPNSPNIQVGQEVWFSYNPDIDENNGHNPGVYRASGVKLKGIEQPFHEIYKVI